MDAAQTEKLKALELAATKGPWKLGSSTLTTHQGCEGSWWELHSIMMAPEGKFAHWQAGFVRDQADAEFIAACRTAVPELIAEVERLRAELASQCRAEGGNTSQVGCERDDGLLNIHAESETCEVCTAPAAGTEKDAERLLREARAVLETWKDIVPAVSLCADIDAAIAAHTKAKEGA